MGVMEGEEEAAEGEAGEVVVGEAEEEGPVVEVGGDAGRARGVGDTRMRRGRGGMIRR